MRLLVVKSAGQVKRAQTAPQKQMAWLEARLKPWPARVGTPRWTKKRLNHGIRKALKHDPEGQWDNVTGIGCGKQARELRVEVEGANMPEAPLVDGRSARVTTRPPDTYTTDQVFQLVKAQHDVERRNHILKGHLMVTPVYLKKPMRSDGLWCILWPALLVYLWIDRK